MATLSLASASVAGATDPPITTEPPDPTPSVCVSLTKLTSFTATNGPFQGGTRLAWNVAKGCPEVTIRLDGQAVGASATKTVDPFVGTEYRLTAAMGTAQKTLGTQVAIGADVVDYTLGRGGLVPTRNGTGVNEVEAARVSAQVTGTLARPARQRLVGKVLEVHLIPANVSLTHLPLWRYLSGQSTCHGDPDCNDPIPWSEIRGVGDSSSPLKPANVIAIAAGEETMFRSPAHFYADGGYVLVHELGHAVFGYTIPDEQANVAAARQASIDRGHKYGSAILSNGYNPTEYFAEGTAALFRYASSDLHVHDYMPEFLAREEAELLAILRRVYPGAG